MNITSRTLALALAGLVVVGAAGIGVTRSDDSTPATPQTIDSARSASTGVSIDSSASDLEVVDPAEIDDYTDPEVRREGESQSAPVGPAGRLNTSVELTSSLSDVDPSYGGSLTLGDPGRVPVLHRYGETARASGQTDWTSVFELMEFVVHDTDGYWSNVFAQAGLAEPHVNYLFPAPGQVFAGACGASNDSTAQFCPRDDTITVSTQFSYNLWSGNFVGPDGQTLGGGFGGDFAAAFIVAHEMAHNIQGELGILTAGFSTPQLELHADCWSGVWAADAGRRNLLDPGDIDDGLRAAFLVGDSHFNSPDHHGTSEQRQVAFLHGLESGQPIACDTFLLG